MDYPHDAICGPHAQTDVDAQCLSICESVHDIVRTLSSFGDSISSRPVQAGQVRHPTSQKSALRMTRYTTMWSRGISWLRIVTKCQDKWKVVYFPKGFTDADYASVYITNTACDMDEVCLSPSYHTQLRRSKVLALFDSTTFANAL